MWSKDIFTQAGSRVVLLLGQMFILLACVSYVSHSYTSNILPDTRAKTSFLQANCFVINKRLSGKGRFFRGYRADFLISYTVNGIQYNRWVSGNGLDNSYSRDEQGQEDILSNYDVGGHYPCQYDPINPQFSLLVPRRNWLSTLPLFAPTVIFLITFYYFYKNCFALLRMAHSKISTKRKPRQRKTNKK